MLNNNVQLIIPLISVTLVAILGFVSNILIFRINQKQSISNKIIEQYFKIRDEITNKISDLATLKTIADVEIESIDMASADISKLYYKHYDFLPIEVLNDILCLHSTLINKDNKIYRIRDKSIYEIEENELEDYIQSTSDISDSKYYTYCMLKSKDIKVRRATCINLQARKVLNTMNKFFTLDKLIYWEKYIRKN